MCRQYLYHCQLSPGLFCKNKMSGMELMHRLHSSLALRTCYQVEVTFAGLRFNVGRSLTVVRQADTVPLSNVDAMKMLRLQSCRTVE